MGSALVRPRRPWPARTGVCRALASLLATVLAPAPAAALDPDRLPSQYQVQSWGIEDGLPGEVIWAIHQTRDGYLWLGTSASGLVRFDGASFEHFGPVEVPELGNGRVRTLYEDPHGALWIGLLGSGLVRYRDGEFESFGVEEGLPSLLVRALAPAPGGGLWVGTDGGGVALLRDGRVVERVTTAEGLLTDDVWTLAASPAGDLWIGGNQTGLSRLRDGRITTWSLEDGLASRNVNALLESSDGGLWIATSWGLNRLEGDRIVAGWEADAGLSSDYLFSLEEDRDGNLWIGTGGGGVNRFAGGRFAAITAADGLANEYVWAIHEDREGNLWVATEDGLTRMRSGPAVPWGVSQGLLGEEARAVHGRRDGGVWLATDGGLNRLEDGRVETWSQRDGLPFAGVWSLLETSSGELWLSGDPGGVAHLRDGRFTVYTKQDGLGASTVWSLLEDRGGAIWAGTQGGGLSRFAGGRWSTLKRADGLGSDVVRVLLEDRRGAIWAGTSGGGLSRIDGGRITTFTTRDGLGSDSVMALYEDADGGLWIGTNAGGLTLYRDGRFGSAGPDEGFVAGSVGGIVEDGLGYLWLSTDRGVVRVRRTELVEWIEDPRGPLEVRRVGRSDGIAATVQTGFTPPSWRSRDGRLWFSTRRGVVALDPHRLPPLPPPPPLAIERMLANHEPVDLRTAPVLPAGTFDLEVHYTALSFVAPDSVRFRYLLSGFDDEWVDAGERRVAYYTNLPPGRYRFEVAAANEHGVWSPEPAALDLRLLPHFWQTAWFRALLVALAALAAYGLYRLRVTHLEARAAVAEERNRLAREIHDTIAQDLGAILMQARAAQREAVSGPAPLRERLERIGGFAERGLEEAWRALSALRPRLLEGQGLAAALEERARTLGGSGSGSAPAIEVRSRGLRRPIEPEVEAELLRIGGEAVTNAVKHAGARRIAVDLEIGRRIATLAVHDDGRGFDPGAVGGNGAGGAKSGGGFGLLGMRERVDALGGRLAVESAAGAGTRVEVRVPLRRRRS